ncbi:hypothetical protein ACP70R_001644 [Stipagrostis hirtigluma subsp. patula]
MARQLATATATALLVLLAAALAAAGPEADALRAFRAALRRPPPVLDEWLDWPEPCAGGGHRSPWYGVTCDELTGRVSALGLAHLALGGPMPDLSLLAPLSSLSELDLSSNSFTGVFPDVSVLAKLDLLYLAHNNLSGEIPDGAFAKTPRLRWLSLANNEFTGPIPSSIATTPMLKELSLSNNHFQGRLPDFKQNDLQVVDVSYNNLSGPIPSSIATAPMLNWLSLSNNHFQGHLPNFEQNNLWFVDVSYNNLSGPIPIVLRRFDASWFKVATHASAARRSSLSATRHLPHRHLQRHQCRMQDKNIGGT